MHYFLVDYGNKGEYYQMVMEGDLERVEKCLQKLSQDVRFITNKEETKYDNGKKILEDGIIIRRCKFKYSLRPIIATPGFQKNFLPPDSRHTILKEKENG